MSLKRKQWRRNFRIDANDVVMVAWIGIDPYGRPVRPTFDLDKDAAANVVSALQSKAYPIRLTKVRIIAKDWDVARDESIEWRLR